MEPKLFQGQGFQNADTVGRFVLLILSSISSDAGQARISIKMLADLAAMREDFMEIAVHELITDDAIRIFNTEPDGTMVFQLIDEK